MSAHIVVYSHGFGVRKDDRGLMPDIAAALPECTHILFDYNRYDSAHNTLTVAPLHDQVARLRQQVETARASHRGATVDIVAHSQGCIVAAMARPVGVRKAILLAPPSVLDPERLIKVFAGRPGTHIDLEGVSRLARRDGSVTVVPPGYWQSIKDLKLIELYQQLSISTEVTIFQASHDEVLGETDFQVSGIDVEVLAANHDFTDNRQELVRRIGIRIRS